MPRVDGAEMRLSQLRREIPETLEMHLPQVPKSDEMQIQVILVFLTTVSLMVA